MGCATKRDGFAGCDWKYKHTLAYNGLIALYTYTYKHLDDAV